MAIRVAPRSDLAPFMVMSVMRQAAALEAAGKKVLHLEVGQPASPAPAAAIRAITAALPDPASHGYTLALGQASLRQAIAELYERWYGISLAAERVVVTVGSSLGFAMAFLTCFSPGERIALVVPGYPAYRNLLSAVGLEAVSVPARAEAGWVPSIAALEALDPKPDGLILASPSNPTGVVLPAELLAGIACWCHNNNVRLIADEIYHGISFETAASTALAYSESVLVVNSLSKYFSMTGHRVGWMVVPDDLVDPMERLAQNLIISVPTLSQIAARAAISEASAHKELQQLVARYRENRDILLENLNPQFLGNHAPAMGAFYLYADTSALSDDSSRLCHALLHEAGVAMTPGVDFDPEQGHHAVRLSFAGSSADMLAASQAINRWLDTKQR